MKKILCVFAHPDDESFGPGGTIIKWANEGNRIHLLCATKGEAGMNRSKGAVAKTREKELLAASQILGIESIKFLGFIDGNIGNSDLAKLEKLIIQKIRSYKPDVVLTFDLNGISGHLDHIAVASATTQAFNKTKIAKKIYYLTIPKGKNKRKQDYFVYRPEGRRPKEIDEVINVTPYWETKLLAMQTHKSQIKDSVRLRKYWSKGIKREYFIVKDRKS